MASSGSIYSQTLQEITTTKLNELAKKQKSFEQRKAAAIQTARSKHKPLEQLAALADGVAKSFSIDIKDGQAVHTNGPRSKIEVDLVNLKRFLSQARFDPSISESILTQWRQNLLNHLEVQTLKYKYADLYGKLVMEWLSASDSSTVEVSDEAMETMSQDYEKVSARAKLESRQNWEASVFVEAPVDEAAITRFLSQLFSSKEAQEAITKLRENVRTINDTLAGEHNFSRATLDWTIAGLLVSDLLTDEKRQVLREFQSNDVILAELADVLNMRLSAVESWSWGDHVDVELRRQLNGTYNVYMHEDLLQAIFLQYIGVMWSTKFKSVFRDFITTKGVWKVAQQALSPRDHERRRWYLNEERRNLETVQRVRSQIYRAGFFVSQLMDDVRQNLAFEEGDEEAVFESTASAAFGAQAMQAPMHLQQAPSMAFQQGSLFGASAQQRQANAVGGIMAPRLKRKGKMAHHQAQTDLEEDDEEEDEEDMGFGLFSSESDDSKYKPKNPMDAKQRLLHLLATEILVKTRIHGEITCFRSQYDTWNPLLPHATIKAVLQYFGVPEKWLSFFDTFLQAPLKFVDDDAGPRFRKRGTPGAHVLSDVFGETVLFCLDFAINQHTGGEKLWRTYDDFWFWSSSEKTCVDAWNLIGDFNKLMGLSLNESKGGSVRIQLKSDSLVEAIPSSVLPVGEIRWGMIRLDAQSGRFLVDQKMVDKHIEELRKQLKDKEKSIFSWIQAYSTYATVFFTSNFGRPANCFGREHIDMMLSMHERVQKTLFTNSDDEEVTSVVDWLKKQILLRFGVDDIPDGYLFFPSELGGLQVKSPFVGLLQIRDSVTKSPTELLDKFQEAERKEYNRLKIRYQETKKWEYHHRSSDEYRPDNPMEFMPFDEYIKFREEVGYNFDDELIDVYKRLLERPHEEALEYERIGGLIDALNRLPGNGPITQWFRMEPYWKWVSILYGPEMLEKFGGFDIVDPALLPMGMVSLFRSGRVSWGDS